MGNIITLLGFGKKVYVRSDVTCWKMFEEKGIKLFDIKKEIDLRSIDKRVIEMNKKTLKNFFSGDIIKSMEDDF